MAGGETEDQSREEESMNMFRRLHRFIQGDNREEVVMKMNVPVFTFRHPNTASMVAKMTMCFWLTQDNQVLIASHRISKTEAQQ